MAVSAVTPHVMPLVERTGGPTLRDQIKAQMRALGAQEQAQLLKAKTPDAKDDVHDKFDATRKELGEKYAAMLCSVEGWQPKEGASEQSKVLTAYYQLLGQKGRALAAKEGKPFSLQFLDKVKLSRDDVKSLRTQFGDEAVKKALPLLQRHICHGRWMSAAAMKFMNSSEFVAYHTAIDASRDQMDRGIEVHREKLDDKAAEDLRDELRAKEKRQLTNWTENVVTLKDERNDGTREKTTYAAVGGRLIPVDKKTEQ